MRPRRANSPDGEFYNYIDFILIGNIPLLVLGRYPNLKYIYLSSNWEWIESKARDRISMFKEVCMIYIETPRLILRDWKEEDLQAFRELNSDKEVMGDFPKTYTEEETDAFYKAIKKEFEECNFGLYAAEVKESSRFIGMIGFHRASFEADFTPCVEIGWRLKRDAWGKGYATEGAKACLEYGFTKLNFKEVYSFTAKINKPSENVMKKIGMHYVKDFDHPRIEPSNKLCRHVLYVIRNIDLDK